MRRALLVVAVLAGGVLVLAAPAAADLTGPCTAQGTIEGTTYTPANDTPGSPVVIPKEGTVAWEGGTTTGITNHSGRIRVHIGPVPITVANWAHPNTPPELIKSGTYDLADAYDKLPFNVVGIYRVSGEHEGEGGRCEGFVYVKLEGNPLGTPVGAAATVIGLASLAGLVFAGVSKP